MKLIQQNVRTWLIAVRWIKCLISSSSIEFPCAKFVSLLSSNKDSVCWLGHNKNKDIIQREFKYLLHSNKPIQKINLIFQVHLSYRMKNECILFANCHFNHWCYYSLHFHCFLFAQASNNNQNWTLYKCTVMICILKAIRRYGLVPVPMLQSIY